MNRGQGDFTEINTIRQRAKTSPGPIQPPLYIEPYRLRKSPKPSGNAFRGPVVRAFLWRYRFEWLAGVLLAGGTLLAFARVLDCDFVNFDDTAFVLRNMDVQAGLSDDGIFFAFTDSKVSGFWHPLSWMSLQLDHDLFGLQPWGYHLTNLLLHVANTLLLFAALRWMTGAVWRSAAVAALFALHPLHVEPVAWVASRKDVLSTCFWMLTTLCYLWFVQRPRFERYFLMMLLFALGLLSKPMLVTLPCTLLLLDWWPLRRLPTVSWRRLLLEKLPLFALAAASSAASVFFMTGRGSLRGLEGYPLGPRLSNVVVSYAVYLRRVLWPNDLTVFYPLPLEGRPPGQVLAAVAVLLLVSALCVWQARRRPYLLMGWLWYLGTLVPAIGLFQVANHTLADRYTYVPLIGIFWAAVWFAADVVPARLRRPVLVPATLAVLLLCGWASWRQLAVWHDSVALWENALAYTENNYLAHYSLALELEGAGQLDDARTQHLAAVRMRDWDARAHVKLAQAYGRLGQPRAALASYRRAVELAPQNVDFRFYLAQAYRRLGDTAAAERETQEGERLYWWTKR